MNLVILFPIVLLAVAIVIFYFGRRNKAGGSGLGNRPDEAERPELRGSEQWKKRSPH